MVASLVTSSRSRRRRSVTSRTRTSAPMCSPCGRSGIERTISDAAVAAELGVAVRPAAEHRAQGLLVGAAPRRHQLPGHVGQDEPGQVAGEAEPPVDRERVRAGVDDPARRRRPGRSRPRPAASRRGRCAAPGAGKWPWRDHLGQVGGRLQVGQLQPARGAHAEQVGVAGDHGDHPAGRGVPGSSRPAPARRRATPGRPRGPAGPGVYAASSSGRRPVGMKVPTMSSTYAVGPVVGPHLAAGPEAAALAVGQPEHQVGERKIRDDLPVRLQAAAARRRPRRRGPCGCAPAR